MHVYPWEFGKESARIRENLPSAGESLFEYSDFINADRLTMPFITDQTHQSFPSSTPSPTTEFSRSGFLSPLQPSLLAIKPQDKMALSPCIPEAGDIVSASLIMTVRKIPLYSQVMAELRDEGWLVCSGEGTQSASNMARKTYARRERHANLTIHVSLLDS